MGRLYRFRKMCAKVVLVTACNGKQDALAAELRRDLQLDDQMDIRPLVFRYLNGELVNSGVFEAIHLVFWRTIVRGEYPLAFLTWLERAYATYDLVTSDDPLGKSDVMMVRALLGEARLLFLQKSPHADRTCPRYEAARQLMLGIAAAVEQRTLKTGQASAEKGIQHLEEAIRLFGSLKTGERALSNSDEFHMACALHMMDWLVSELPDGEKIRKQKLELMRELGALRAYEWLANQINDWLHQYNISEIHGELSLSAGIQTVPVVAPRAAIVSLMRAIELNPRLGDFDADTKFDTIDEPLSKAPALRHILPIIRAEHKKWLQARVKAYRNHAELYKKDTAKAIKAMLKDLEEAQAPKLAAIKYAIAIITVAIITLATSSFVLDGLAYAKPSFG